MALRLNKIKKPNVIMNLSNAPMHEIESLSVTLMRTMDGAANRKSYKNMGHTI